MKDNQKLITGLEYVISVVEINLQGFYNMNKYNECVFGVNFGHKYKQYFWSARKVIQFARDVFGIELGLDGFNSLHYTQGLTPQEASVIKLFTTACDNVEPHTCLISKEDWLEVAKNTLESLKQDNTGIQRMTITSKIVENTSLDTPKEVKFPVLAQLNNSKKVVLFISEREGVVLVEGEGIREYPVGLFCDCWVDVTNKDCWTILPNDVSIVLSNNNQLGDLS